MPCLSPDRSPGSGFRVSGSGHSPGLRAAPGLAYRAEQGLIIPRSYSRGLLDEGYAKVVDACLLICHTLVNKTKYLRA